MTKMDRNKYKGKVVKLARCVTELTLMQLLYPVVMSLHVSDVHRGATFVQCAAHPTTIS